MVEIPRGLQREDITGGATRAWVDRVGARQALTHCSNSRWKGCNIWLSASGRVGVMLVLPRSIG